MDNQYWKHKYFEKNSHELHTNIFRSLEIEQYLKKVLKNYGFNLHNHKLNFSNFVINIFLSIYKNKTDRKIRLKNKNKLLDLNKKIENYYKKKSINNSPTKIKYIKTLKLYRNCLLKFQKDNETKKFDSISKKIIESLNLFIKNKYNIVLTIQEINFVNLNSKTEQTLINFRKFEKAPFFIEGSTLLTPMVTHKNSAKLLSDFIALQLRTKRHNFFLNFLKESLNFIINQKFSRIKGIKVIIKGRLNNAARSRHYLIKVGKISLIKIKSKINYSESVAFTSNGTLGIKVWINEKI
jgi:small subunit ribosomal protein S3